MKTTFTDTYILTTRASIMYEVHKVKPLTKRTFVYIKSCHINSIFLLKIIGQDKILRDNVCSPILVHH